MGSGPPPSSSRNWAERGLSSSPKIALLQLIERQEAITVAMREVAAKMGIRDDEDDD